MAETLDQLKLAGNCDTIAMCSDGRRFVVGTYELQEGDEQVRHGSISLFTSDGKKFVHVTTIPAPAGVLDIKFRRKQTLMRHNGSEVFAVALADGTVRLGCVTLDDQVIVDDGYTCASSPSRQNELTLSVSWSPVGSSETRVAATFSTGFLREYTLSDDMASLALTKEHAIGNLETWAVCHNDSTIFTGGDDCKLWLTTRTDDQSRVIRRFESGVTSIEADPHAEGHLLVGTYEDKLYQFDLRMMRDPEQEVEIGGGVWRIKDHPEQPELLAIAGMYAGAFIVDRRPDKWRVKQHFRGHESMCYGVEWWDKRTLLSCSFYDGLLAMWSLEE